MSIQYAVLFDMDGTLLQTEKMAVPAFKNTFAYLREHQLWDGPIPDDNQFTNVLGMTLSQLWDTLLPGGSPELKELADRIMLENELALLRKGEVDLFPGVKELLATLHQKGIALFVASNGKEEYVDSICEYFELKRLFTDLYSSGRFHTKSKTDLVRKLVQDYAIGQAVMVGDRRSDIEAGKQNGLMTVACDFGFAKPGELDEADVKIRRFSELAAHLPFPVLHSQKS